ncbi:hypothetical protein DR999_PMT07132 [Platysternon megacephalum]|uniref:Uncharacterized protein n=1 Tax=Platysternon megacephalum TaxID=55544 RepID=A0A4D9ERI6_9SAUR|nr:hypothetical protein DR999_PMT07132 [Platysternon megacephalum]
MCFKEICPISLLTSVVKNRTEWDEITSTTHFNMDFCDMLQFIQQLLHQQRIIRSIFPASKYTIHLRKRVNLEDRLIRMEAPLTHRRQMCESHPRTDISISSTCQFLSRTILLKLHAARLKLS